MTKQAETPIRIGTRGSALALTQAKGLAGALQGLGRQAEICIIKTQGDKDQVRPFAQVGEPGLFVRELERALIEGEVDLAVHSYKDLPSDSPAELVVVASPKREDPRDRLLIHERHYLAEAAGLPLAEGARVGTASARRRALVQDLRPDLECVHLRGNVPTRVDKLRVEGYEAILLASAGLERLDLAARNGECPPIDRAGLIEINLDPRAFVPAPSQGALALQVRRDDTLTSTLVLQLDCPTDHRAVRAERALLALVEAGCQVPFGAIALPAEGGSLSLVSALEVEGKVRRVTAEGSDPQALAQEAFELLFPGGR